MGKPIPRALVRGQSAGLWAPGELAQYRIGKQFGVAESVGHPVRGDGILEVTGVSYQRPASSPTVAQVAG
jgi:hypothetical protein